MYNYCINIIQMLFPLQYFDLWLIPIGPVFPAINCFSLCISLGFEATVYAPLHNYLSIFVIL